MKDKVIYKSNFNQTEYSELAIWCNDNGYKIVDKGDRYVAEEDIVTQAEINQSQIAELKAWFEKDYRYFSEKLTRFAALDIQESVTDTMRNKTYTTLDELYREAEKVRFEINELVK